MPDQDQCQALYEAGRAAWRQRDAIRARRYLEPLSHERLTGMALGNWRLTYGVVLRELGDLRLAMEQFEAFMQDLGEYPDLEAAAGYGWFNMGLCRRQLAGRPGGAVDQDGLRAAMEDYRRAAEEFVRESMPKLLARTLHNWAWAACLVQDSDLAAELLEQAEDLHMCEADRWHQTLGWALVEAVRGENHAALVRCERITTAHEAPLPVRSQACWIAGRVALQLGQTDEAERLARSALEYGTEVPGDSRCYADAAALLRSVLLQRKSAAGS